MPIISLKKRGNRRSVNNPEGGTASTTETVSVAEALSDKPKISSQSFKYPGTPPIRQIPSIRNVLETPKPVASELAPSVAEPAGPDTPEAQVEKQPQETTESLPDNKKLETRTDEPKSFEECWQQMFEEVFSSNPMIYHPLKEKLPVLEDGVIKVEVLNDFQKEQYEMRKRALLEYWRNHFPINVDDVEINVNEHLEMKKIIYSAEDKLQNLEEQNPELGKFLQELNFRIRD